MRKMFRVGMAGLAACATLVFAASCDLDNDAPVQPDSVSYVAIYNASPNAPNLDIEVDNRQINNSPFEYADYTGYLRFYTGDRNLKFSPNGASNIVIDTTITFEDENAYSVFVVDEYDNVEVLVLNDNSAAPASGKAKVRFVNLSPDAESITLAEKDQATPIAEDKSFKQASDFIEVDAKSYNFEITSAGENGLDLDVPSVNLKEGWFYTIIVRGYKTPPGGNPNVISAEVVVN